MMIVMMMITTTKRLNRYIIPNKPSANIHHDQNDTYLQNASFLKCHFFIS